MYRRFMSGLAAASVAILLAACGGDGIQPPPGGDPPPSGGDTFEISGSVRTPTVDANIRGTVISICTGGSGCASTGSILAQTEIDQDGRQAPFGFTNVPAGNYDLVAFQELHLDAPAPPGVQVPDVWYFARVRAVSAGSTDVMLDMDLDASEPTNGTAVMTGTLELPGSLGTTSGPSGTESGITAVSVASAGHLADRPEAGTADQLQVMASTARTLNEDRPTEVIPGEIVIAFEDDIAFSLSALSTLSVAGTTLHHLSGGPEGELHLYEVQGIGQAATIALAAELGKQPHIKTAMPNWRLHTFAAPNDESYPLQWHYRSLNMEAAWNIETGVGGDVTVAVVDTGSISHPDLDFTGGYDFVTDTSNEGDGTGGRDSNPRDEGDEYHGAHVAGTVAARTNNSIGVAGTSWGATVVPVRALGVDGSGSGFDILDSVLWAAGESVSGVPSNPNPADIINLSLGADLGVTCADALGGSDSFFSDLIERTGVIIVAAAGNSGINARHTFPASCPGVITVGATGPSGQQAPYSNYGPDVDVMAPGGDLTRSFRAPDGKSHPAGVLSTVLDNSGAPGYVYYQGTSMAAPHISGVLALMLAADPGLSPAEVLDTLRSSASSVPGCGPGECGAGSVDAAAALATGDVPEPPVPPAPPPVASVPIYILFEYCLDGPCDVIDTEKSQYVRLDNMDVPVAEYVTYHLQPGRYFVWAFHDLDDSGDFSAGEPFGLYGQVILESNSVTHGVDMRLESFLD